MAASGSCVTPCGETVPADRPADLPSSRPGERSPDRRSAVVLVRGTGSIGLRHLRVLRDRVGARAVALPTRPERAAELSALGFDVAADFGAAPGDGPLRTVVATDTSRHVSDAREALQRGDVLVEKPLSADRTGLAELAHAASELGHSVHVAFCLRFDAGLRAFRTRLPEIGGVHAVRIECQSFLPSWRPGSDYRASYSARAAEGGVLRDLAHELDYAVWLFGRPTAVFCALANSGRLGIESEEAADLFWRAPSGASVSIRLDYLSPVARRRMRATGPLGELEWDAVAGEVTLRRAGAEPEREQHRVERDDMYVRQAEAFLRAADGGDADGLATLDEGAFVVALSDAARESSRTGCLTRVPDWRAA